ncbi:MAG: hypothetical protein R3B13_25305 [Polyangiaceae bacterium]
MIPRWQWTPVASLMAAVLFAPTAAHADAKKECAAAYVEAQTLKRDNSLKAAREQLIICARDSCMSAVKKDCLTWLDEVNAALPSIVVVAKDSAGKETLNVKVTADEQVVAEQLDTKGIELDPGTHKVKFELEGEDPVEREVILRAGQKNKVIEVQFGNPDTAAPPPPVEDPAAGQDDVSFDTDKMKKKSVPTVSYVLAGVGAVALAGTAFFWLGAEGEKSDLESSGCSPNCAQDDVDSIKQKRLFGDIALGVGVVSLGAAAYFWLSADGKSAPAPAESARVDFIVREQGAFATVRGVF